MRQLELKLQLVTPIFIGGADAGNLAHEVRAPSARGQLRYWLRAILGRKRLSLAQLQQQEAALLGSTEAGSLVRLRFVEPQPLQVAQRMMLPHREPATGMHERGRSPLPQDAFVEGQTLQLLITPRPGLESVPDELMAALLLWLSLGGLGKRSRRGFGSLQISGAIMRDGLVVSETARALLDARPEDAKSLRTHLAALTAWVETLVPSALPATALSDYPILEPQVASVRAGVAMPDYGQPMRDYRQAMVPFWLEALRAYPRADDRAYGHARGGRRASPFHLHIGDTEEGYHLVLTTFWSAPDPGDDANGSGWGKVGDLLDFCETAWGASVLWGRA